MAKTELEIITWVLPVMQLPHCSADTKLIKKDDSWVFRTADAATTAREIEHYFAEVLGAEGGEQVQEPKS